MTALIDTSFLLATVAPHDQNHALAREALRTIKSGQRIAAPVLTDSDYTRMDAIMRQYRDARFDLADAAQMALAERLDVRQVYTFDRRDFRLFKPAHCDALDLLP
ncbi:MAG: hypothetical protein AAFV33_11325 [Chloroflexota bacterium]